MSCDAGKPVCNIVLFGHAQLSIFTLQLFPKGGCKKHIKITTVENEDGSVITIEDSGPGLDNAGENDQPHTAILNIKKRLALMCNGTLTLRNRDDDTGTIATIFIPKQ